MPVPKYIAVKSHRDELTKEIKDFFLNSLTGKDK